MSEMGLSGWMSGDGNARRAPAPVPASILDSTGPFVTVIVSKAVPDAMGPAVGITSPNDGILTRTSTSALLTTDRNARKALLGQHALLGKAYGAKGNADTSAFITVNP
jgi:hypothetical protein